MQPTNKNLWLLFASTTLAATSLSACASPTCSSPVGDWTNQLGSTLSIAAIDPTTGQISGTYSSPSGTSGQKFPLIGWMNTAPADPKRDNAVILSFSVRWGPYHTVTSWTGVCRVNPGAGADTLTAIWHLGEPVADFEWKHVVSGQDIFHPKP